MLTTTLFLFTVPKSYPLTLVIIVNFCLNFIENLFIERVVPEDWLLNLAKFDEIWGARFWTQPHQWS